MFIPYEHIRTLWNIQEENEEVYDKLLVQLTASGWLEKAEEPEAYKLHAVIQEVILDEEELIFEEVENIVHAFRYFLEGVGGDISVYQRPLGLKLPYLEYVVPILSKIKTPHESLADFGWRALDRMRDAGRLQEALEVIEMVIKVYLYLENLRNEGALSERKGQILMDMGNFAEAESAFKKQLKISKTLLEKPPNSIDYKRILGNSYSKLGSLLQAQGKFDEALAYFEKLRVIFEELSASNPTSEELKNGLAISYSKLGSLLQAQGKFEEALAYFEKRSHLGEELSVSNPASEELKNGLAISYLKLGSLLQAQENFEEALACFEKLRVIFEELSASNPASEELKNGLAISYRIMGEVLRSLDRPTEAHKYFKKLFSLANGLFSNNPNNYNLKFRLAEANWCMGDVLGDLEKEKNEILKYYKTSLSLCKELLEETSLPIFQRNVDALEDDIRKLV